MPSFFRSAAALALAGAAVANPLNKRDDACIAAVTGKAALGDEGLRKEHCSSYFRTIVTPAAITVTTTITDAPKPSNWNQWEKKDVTVCPNEVPNYASKCDDKGYRSACRAWGVSYDTTITIPATTYTKTVYVDTGKPGECGAKTVTIAGATTTVTLAKETVTVTKDGNYGPPHGTTTGSYPPKETCLTKEKALEFSAAFKNLLEYTDKGSAATNNGPYNYSMSAKYLAEDFKDYSDSINWMAHIPLGGVTFPSRAVFDQQQGQGQDPLVITDMFTQFGCKHITWKWSALTKTRATVMGINFMEISDDLTKITANHAEFNNAAWIQSFSAFNPTINCQTPQQPAQQPAAGTTTTSAAPATTTSATPR